MFLLLLPQNASSWTTYCRPLESYFSLLLMVTLWWSPPSNVFIVPYLTPTSLLVFPFYFSSSNTYHIFLYIIPYLLSLPATNNFILPTLSFFTFLHVLLLVHHDATGLSPLSALCPLVHILYSLSALVLFLSVIPLFKIPLLLPSLFLLLL